MTFLPPEFSPHAAIWTAFPAHRDWGAYQDAAREEVITLVRLLSGGDRVKVLAKPGEAYEAAHQALHDIAEVIEAPYGDIWLRDTGPLFGTRDEGRGMEEKNQPLTSHLSPLTPHPSSLAPRPSSLAHRFRFNGWGGKFVYEGDEAVGGIIAARTGAKTIRHDFILEGGSIELDGEGLCLTTRQCLLNKNRNPGWTKDIAEQKLIDALGVKKILWLDEGLMGDHTDGHIDNIARFVAPGHVVCQTPNGADDPNAETLNRIIDALGAMTDATGAPLQISTVPSPGRFEAEGAVQAASHMNFIIGNKTVVVPAYNAAAEDAVKALQPLFPGREVVHASSRALVTGGGSFHCITQQQPA